MELAGGRAPFGSALLGRPMSAVLRDELLNRAVAADDVLSHARGVSEAYWLETSAEQSRRLKALIDAVRPCGRLLVQVISAINGANFIGADKSALIDSLSSSAAAPQPAKWQPQSFVEFPLFMTAEVWGFVLSDSDIIAKGRVILSHLAALGLKHVHEPTFATAASLLILGQEGALRARTLPTQYVDNIFTTLKTLWKK